MGGYVTERLVVGHHWMAPQGCLRLGCPLHWGRHHWVLLPMQLACT